jgi:hypothetical protein
MCAARTGLVVAVTYSASTDLRRRSGVDAEMVEARTVLTQHFANAPGTRHSHLNASPSALFPARLTTPLAAKHTQPNHTNAPTSAVIRVKSQSQVNL